MERGDQVVEGFGAGLDQLNRALGFEFTRQSLEQHLDLLGHERLERALAGEKERVSAAEVRRRYDVPKEVLDRLAELEVLSPSKRGYSPSDVRIVEAIGRFRAGGYDERIGFTVYDTLRYKRALEAIAAEEVKVLVERLGEIDPDQAVEMIEAGVEPLADLISALHTKLLAAELERHRDGHEP